LQVEIASGNLETSMPKSTLLISLALLATFVLAQSSTRKKAAPAPRPNTAAPTKVTGDATKTLSGLTPAEIATVSPEIVERLFRQNISMGKGMGLMSMVGAVRTLALRAQGVEAKPVSPLACPE
jgi:hypothetical protein